VIKENTNIANLISAFSYGNQTANDNGLSLGESNNSFGNYLKNAVEQPQPRHKILTPSSNDKPAIQPEEGKIYIKPDASSVEQQPTPAPVNEEPSKERIELEVDNTNLTVLPISQPLVIFSEEVANETISLEQVAAEAIADLEAFTINPLTKEELIAAPITLPEANVANQNQDGVVSEFTIQPVRLLEDTAPEYEGEEKENDDYSEGFDNEPDMLAPEHAEDLASASRTPAPVSSSHDEDPKNNSLSEQSSAPEAQPKNVTLTVQEIQEVAAIEAQVAVVQTSGSATQEREAVEQEEVISLTTPTASSAEPMEKIAAQPISAEGEKIEQFEKPGQDLEQQTSRQQDGESKQEFAQFLSQDTTTKPKPASFAASTNISQELQNKAVEQVTAKIQVIGAINPRQDSQMRIQLQPESLGPVDLIIKTEGEITRVQILTEKMNAHHIMQLNSDEIKAVLAEQGFNNDNSSLEFGCHQFQQQRNGDENSNQHNLAQAKEYGAEMEISEEQTMQLNYMRPKEGINMVI
jgi:hypothetical protein